MKQNTTQLLYSARNQDAERNLWQSKFESARLFYSYRQTQGECLGRERKRQLRRFRDGFDLSQTRSHERCIDVEVLESPLVMRRMAVIEILYSYLFTALTMFHFCFVRALKI